MKEEIKIAKDLDEFYRSIVIPAITNAGQLRIGNWRLDHIRLLPREAVGLFFVAKVLEHTTKSKWTVGSDPRNGDGTVFCYQHGFDSDIYVLLEQVYVPLEDFQAGEAIANIERAVIKKASEGPAYQKGRSLLVFADREGDLHETALKELSEKIMHTDFDSVWLLTKISGDTEYKYLLYTLKSGKFPTEVYEVILNIDPDSFSFNERSHI